ncbi:hypothetical protein GCM10020254_69800 [Streptomyces goshikiensis]
MERTLWAKRVFLRLGPLWRALREATPAVAAALPVPWWDVELKATRRVAEVQDGRLALRPYRNPDVARAAAARASALRLAPAKVAAAVEAAVLGSTPWPPRRRRGTPSPRSSTTAPRPRCRRSTSGRCSGCPG